jgi:hypothetical protein
MLQVQGLRIDAQDHKDHRQVNGRRLLQRRPQQVTLLIGRGGLCKTRVAIMAPFLQASLSSSVVAGAEQRRALIRSVSLKPFKAHHPDAATSPLEESLDPLGSFSSLLEASWLLKASVWQLKLLPYVFRYTLLQRLTVL